MELSILESIDDDFLGFCWINLPPQARAKILENAPSTVWIFGAGASHDYDLNRFGVPVPLASGFFEAFNSLPTSQRFGAHVGPLISFLEHYRGVDPRKVYTFTENIEDFMTSIEQKIGQLREKKRKRPLSRKDFSDAWSYATVFNNMNFLFANVLNESQNGASASLYHVLLQLCSPNDTFVTFNWDTLLDRALVDSGGWSPNDGYGVRFAAALDESWKPSVEGNTQYQIRWKLLKLHGSTNWLVPHLGVNFQSLEYLSIVPDSDKVFLYWHSSLSYPAHNDRWRGGYAPTCYGYYPPNIPAKLFHKRQISAGPGKVFVKTTPRLFSPFSEPEKPGIPSSPLLITPVRQKKYGMYASTIQNVWKQAEKAIMSAERVVVVGYSFPPTDVRAMELLKDCLKARKKKFHLELVAPGVDGIAARIGKRSLSQAKSVMTFDMTFEQYLHEYALMAPTMMREAAIRDKHVHDWVLMLSALHQTTAEQRREMHTHAERV